MPQIKDAILTTEGVKVVQQGRPLYIFSLRSGEIHDLISKGKMDIDRWSPQNGLGYQRVPTDSRYKKFGKYVAVNKGISPVSILLSLRDKDALEVEPIGGSKRLVKLRVFPNGGKLFIPDGQHRAYGVKWAVETYPGECEDYELPAVLFVAEGDDPRFEEAQQFYTINQNAKRVRTDLAQRYVLMKRERDLGKLTEKVGIPSDVPVKDLEPYSVKIADILNAEGSLKGRINPPNDPQAAGSISQSSFVDSLRPLMGRAGELGWDIGKTVAVVKAFWGAVKAKCPESWEHWSADSCDKGVEDHINSVLTTTTGMYSLNEILAKSLLLADVAKNPTSPETFKHLLSKPNVEQYFMDGEEGYWANQEDGAAAHGTSRKAFKAITDDIWNDMKEE